MGLQGSLALLVDFDGNHQSAQGHHSFHGIESELFRPHRHLVKDTLHLFMNKGAFHENHLGGGMVEDVLVVGLACRGIDGNQNGTNLLNGEIHHVPLRAVVGNQCNTITFAHTKTYQTLADDIRHFHEVATDVFLPLPFHFAGKHHLLLAEFLHKSRQQVESARRDVRKCLNLFSFDCVFFHKTENRCENRDNFTPPVFLSKRGVILKPK